MHIHKAWTFAIWQYDFRRQPITPEIMERQTREFLGSGADCLLRGWFKWGRDLDYHAMRQVPEALNAFGKLFCGGLTCSVAMPGENGMTPEGLADLTTRHISGEMRPAVSSEKGDCFYWSIHNPKVAEYLTDCATQQVRAGADALHLDEIWAGGTTVAPTKDLGYDKDALRAFRCYLLEKYPDLSPEQWRERFDIDDLDRFDYREYLRRHPTSDALYATDPAALAHQNPLALEWKWPEVTGPQICEEWFEPNPTRSFYEKGVLDFTERLSVGIRQKAKQLGKEVFLSHNGPWPGMDFQNWNVPLQAPGQDWGSFRCHQERWRKFRRLTDQWSGRDAPAVAFLDWPGDLPVFGRWPRHKQETFLRTVPAECYGAECSYAFHLRNLFMDAKEKNLLELTQEICRWFAEHKRLYRPRGEWAPVEVRPDRFCVSAWQREEDVVLHLVNHHEEDGHIVPIKAGKVQWAAGPGPGGTLEVFSPDPEDSRPRIRATGEGLSIDYLYAHAVVRIPRT